DELAPEHLIEHSSIHLGRLADKTEVDIRSRLRKLARKHHIAILAAEPDGAPSLRIDEADNLFVDRTGKHHLDDFHRRPVSDSKRAENDLLNADWPKNGANRRPPPRNERGVAPRF